jgi:hypothetical protein
MWHRESGALLHHVRAQALGGDLTCIAWNHAAEDPFMFATGSHDGGVRIWSTLPAQPSYVIDVNGTDGVSPGQTPFTTPAASPRNLTPQPNTPRPMTPRPLSAGHPPIPPLLSLPPPSQDAPRTTGAPPVTQNIHQPRATPPPPLLAAQLPAAFTSDIDVRSDSPVAEDFHESHDGHTEDNFTDTGDHPPPRTKRIVSFSTPPVREI